MASTTLGGVPLIDPTQLGKAATANSAFGALDLMINGSLSINAGNVSNPYTIPYTAGDEPAVDKTALRFVRLVVTGALTSDWTAFMPAGAQRLFVVQNLTTGGRNVIVACAGHPGVAIPPGQTFLCYLDGTDVSQVPVSAAAVGSEPWDVGNFIDGQPTAGQIVMRWIASRTITFPANFANNQFKAGTAAAGAVVWTVNKNGSAGGTLSVTGGGTTGTWSSTGGAPVGFNARDVGTFAAPNPADATLADIVWTFAGTR